MPNKESPAMLYQTDSTDVKQVNYNEIRWSLKDENDNKCDRG